MHTHSQTHTHTQEVKERKWMKDRGAKSYYREEKKLKRN
jgi:hypothetical protein